MPTQSTLTAKVRTGKRSKALNDAAPRVAAEIRRYCDAHPHALDSIEGIAWWLTWQRFRSTKKRLQLAVDRLVAGGVLKSHRLNDGSMVFGCSQKCDDKKPNGAKSSAKGSSRARPRKSKQ